jgi:hypothetical protein
MENTIQSTFNDNGIISGRMISWSKSTYRQRNPDNEVYFNANIFVLGEGKVFYGDLDITKDKEVLETIAKTVGKDLYILREMDGRFENEESSDKEIISKAVVTIKR